MRPLPERAWNVAAGKRGRMNGQADTWLAGALLLSLFFAAPMESGAGVGVSGLYELRAATVQAFATYVTKTEAENAKSLKAGNFLWGDALDQQKGRAAYERLRRGEVEMR